MRLPPTEPQSAITISAGIAHSTDCSQPGPGDADRPSR